MGQNNGKVLSKHQYNLALGMAKDISENTADVSEIREFLMLLRRLLETNTQQSLESPL